MCPSAADLAARGHLRLGTTDAFFRDRLTGRFETDVATASRTSLMNLATGQWDADLCALFGVPSLPAADRADLGRSGRPARRGAACRLDRRPAGGALRPWLPHAGRREGDLRHRGLRAMPDRGAGPAGPARPAAHRRLAGDGQPVTYALDGGVYAAASAVNWAGSLGLFQTLTRSPPSTPPAIDRGIAFVPALAGLGCPHWNRAARGAWLGLSLADGKADLMQALLEGIALRTAEVLAAMEALHPFRGPVSVDGGLSGNAYFVQFLSEVAGQGPVSADETEQTAAGLARMAAEAFALDLPETRPGRTLASGPEKRGQRAARFVSARMAVEAYAGQGRGLSPLRTDAPQARDASRAI